MKFTGDITETLTETLDLGSYQYDRHMFRSEVLGREVSLGRLGSLVHQSPSTTVYILHGGGADDHQVVDAGLLPHLVTILQKHNLTDVQCIFPSIGSSFLHDSLSNPGSKMESFFFDEVFSNTKTKSNYICGWSMGGRAALNAFFRRPDDFAGVGAHFPTMVSFNVFAENEVRDFGQRSGVSPENLRILIEGFTAEFRDASDLKEYNPHQRLGQLSREQLLGKKIYFDVGDQDEFGLDEGCLCFHNELNRHMLSHAFHLIPGGRHDGAFIHARIESLLTHLLV